MTVLVKTTLRFYAHVIPQRQRDAIERVGLSVGSVVPIGTKNKVSSLIRTELVPGVGVEPGVPVYST
jgi:hypothetical protein